MFTNAIFLGCFVIRYFDISLLRYFDLAVEDKLGGTGHVDMIIRFAPLDAERAAVHDDAALPAGATGECCSYGSSAGTCSAGLGDTAATLPDAGADAAVGLDASELDVAALWEGGMDFEPTSGLTDLVHVVGEDDVVGIAHGDEKSRPSPLPLPAREGSR